MNYRNLIPALCVAAFWMASIVQGRAQVTGGPQVGVELKIIDDAGQPVEGADAVISYIGVVPNTGEAFRSTSGADGAVTAKSALNGLVKAKVTKDGYYPVVWPQVITKGAWDGQPLIQAEIILREIEKPIALHAKKVELAVPAFREWVGYDLQTGEWVKPWGEGVVSDVEFFLDRKFIGYPEDIDERIDHLSKMHKSNPRLKASYVENVASFYGIDSDELTFDEAKRHRLGQWTGELKLRVPAEGGGAHVEKKGYQVFTEESLTVSYARLGHWEMRLPHLAPEDGYRGEPLVWKKSYPSASPPEVDPRVGYFLRTRVKLDGDGEVVSANYAKIMSSDAKYHGSDIHFDPRGKISFTYYFNPTANDRNLEFDPEKNLFADLEDEEKVRLP